MPLSDFYPEMQGWEPAQNSSPSGVPQATASIGPSQSPTNETPSSPYLRTTLPLPLQYAPDTLKQHNRPGLSSFRIAPLPPGGVASVNAASTSVVNSSITSFVSVAAVGPNGAVQFSNGGALAGVSQFVWNNAISTLSILGTLTLSNPLGVASGGTGSNLSATGGLHEVVQQSTVGGAFTVGQLAFTDISGILSVASGGTGTATPGLIAGTDITITGPWPDQTVAVKTQVGVTPGSYTNSNITVDSSGIITAISNGSASQTIASGTAVLGTLLIGSTSSASAVTVSAPGVLTTDSIEWAFNAAPGSGYTSGLFVQAYVTSGNVNFVVTNPTAGGLTPAAATLNWSVIR